MDDARGRDQVRRAVTALEECFTELGALLPELSDDEWELATGCPGWTVRDQVSHVIGLELVLLGTPDPDIDLPPLPHVTERNREIETSVQARRGRPPADVLAELEAVTERRITALRELADSPELDPRAEVMTPVGTAMPLARALTMRAFDVWSHEQDIRRAVGRPGHTDGAAPELVLDTMLRGEARRLGNVAGGNVIGIEVVGDRSATRGAWDLTGESGRYVDGAAAPLPGVTLRVEVATFAALVCGRSDVDPAAVDLDGDVALGRRVVAALAMTP